MSKQKKNDRKNKIRKEKIKNKNIHKQELKNKLKQNLIENQVKKYLDSNKKSDVALDNNLKILKALEDDYRKTMEKRKNLTEELESQGYHSLEDKLNAIKEQSINFADKKLNFD